MEGLPSGCSRLLIAADGDRINRNQSRLILPAEIDLDQSLERSGEAVADAHAPARSSTVARLRARIVAGDYGPGDRLPSERQLIAEMGVARTELRRALETLEREGAIWRHVGKGTFVRDRAGEPGTAVAGLARRTTPVKMMRARLAIEPAIAREAAINASAEAIGRMRLAIERAHAASSWREYEVQDDAFHRSLAEASDNLPLLAIFDQLNAIRREVAWGNVERQRPRPPADHASFAEHERIAAAIEARDPEAAQTAMRLHLRSVAARLFGE